MKPITLDPIGAVHSPFTEQAGTPIQPAAAKDVTPAPRLLGAPAALRLGARHVVRMPFTPDDVLKVLEEARP